MEIPYWLKWLFGPNNYLCRHGVDTRACFPCYACISEHRTEELLKSMKQVAEEARPAIEKKFAEEMHKKFGSSSKGGKEMAGVGSPGQF